MHDTGIGIDEKHKQIIFERFRRIECDMTITKGGSGLGLAISKAYVEMLGGTIALESELGKGSHFSFSIPLIKESGIVPLALNDYSDERTSLDENRQILIAEDDDINYLYFIEIMSHLNYDLIRAHNGIEAVEICSNYNIRLVLMDIKMPEMDGYEALAKIK